MKRGYFIMSHSVESMMYNQRNGNPWHDAKGSIAVDGLATAKQALTKGGLDWKVQTQPVYLADGKKVPKTNAVVRQSDNKILGSVGDRYKPLQNTEAFEFFDNIVGEDEAIYETAGSLKGGKVIWLLTKMPDYIRIDGTDDVIEKKILLTNSHDGSTPVVVMPTPIRVVCNNTLNLALKGSQQQHRVRHTTNVVANLAEAKYTLGLVNEIYSQVDEIFNQMNKTKMKSKDYDEYYNNVFNDGEEEMSTRTENMVLEAKELLEVGDGAENSQIRGSLWHVYNSITEYADHYKSYRKGTDELHAISFGSGARLKQKAMKEAVKTLSNN